MKKLFFCLSMGVLLTIFLCSCTGNEVTEVTYDMLSAEDQQVIDFIYEKAAIWETDDCSEIFGFGKKTSRSPLVAVNTEQNEDETLVFSVFYLTASGINEYSGWVRRYAYDVSANVFELSESEYRYYTIYTSSQKIYSKKWNTSWSMEEKKNALAAKYPTSQ